MVHLSKFLSRFGRLVQRSHSTVAGSEIPNPIVHIPGQGSLKGSYTQSAWSGATIQQFLNIRYAEPPTGERRFKAPVPAEPWEGVLDVSKRGRASPFYGDLKKMTPEELKDIEDCVSLCVYSKDLSGKKPVIVYIHGGGFYSGSAAQHPPEYLLEKDVVLVVPQYRLSALGFLSTKTENIPGNAAMADMLLAFQWVQKYISSFGGDPENVTAFGQSAGAAMISALMFSPVGQDESLFGKVILNSGSGLASSWSVDFNPERNARDIAQRAGCDKGASLAEVEKFLMQLDAYTLLKCFSQHMWQGTPKGINNIGGHRLTIGGPSGILPHTPYSMMQRGGGRKNLPMLTGVVKNEGSFVLVDIFTILAHLKLLGDKEFVQHDMMETLGRILAYTDHSNALEPLTAMALFDTEAIRAGDLKKLIPNLIDLCGTTIIKATVLRSAQYNSRHSPDKTFMYSFDYKGEHTRFGYNTDISRIPFDGGVHHHNDLLYLFPYPKSAAKLNEADTEIAKKMVDLWTSFAIDGVPKSEGVPVWPAFNQVYGPYLHIDKQFSIGNNFLDEFTVTSREAKAKASKK
ncbi:glutactin-like [Uranotaenia lowii]|uniref:glutactin-like n=1 Tax=Uranotaenia lowii TaxID=190385 RepID=UPI002479B955|nr:glutactin-like [Uranotaenia lowii]